MAISVLAIVQARIGSTRLPRKVLKEVRGKPLIEILFQRLSQSKIIDKIILATAYNKENDINVCYTNKIITTQSGSKETTDELSESVRVPAMQL